MGGAIAADPVFDLARTDFWSTNGNPLKHAALLVGYGDLRAGWEEVLPLYSLYHAFELRNWFARWDLGSKRLDRSEADIRKLVSLPSE